jgi:hypothetical protein
MHDNIANLGNVADLLNLADKRHQQPQLLSAGHRLTKAQRCG